MTKRIPIAYIIIAAILLIAFGTAAALNSSASQPVTRKASTLPTPPPTCGYCTTDMLTMSPEEIGEYVLNYLKTAGGITNGTPEVLFSRIITSDELSDLDLGCGTNFSAIEAPPLAAVILHGDLIYSGPGISSVRQDSHYAVIVMDLWAAIPTYQSFSANGDGLGRALNDPTLPVGDSYPSQCPPREQGTRHYGEYAPGFPVPTLYSDEIATLTAGSTNPIPPTPEGGLPTIPRPEPTQANPAP